MVQGRIYLSLPACRRRQVSEPQLTKATHAPKSRGKSFGTTLWHHVQRYCFLGLLFAHAQFAKNCFSYHMRGTKIAAQFQVNTTRVLVRGSSTCSQFVHEHLFEMFTVCSYIPFQDYSLNHQIVLEHDEKRKKNENIAFMSILRHLENFNAPAKYPRKTAVLYCIVRIDSHFVVTLLRS